MMGKVLLIIILVGVLTLGSAYFLINDSSDSEGITCSLVGCFDMVKFTTNEKFSYDISIMADDEVIIDLCEFDKVERIKRLDTLYKFSESNNQDEVSIKIRKEDSQEVGNWKIYSQLKCKGQKILLHEIEKDQVIIEKNQPNGPGCGTCYNTIIDLSS
tara:strand:- start:480 stop:953 length:474 start_codon:yes stop_codon:yes gene_type:complete